MEINNGFHQYPLEGSWENQPQWFIDQLNIARKTQANKEKKSVNDITQKLRLIFGVEGEEKANTQVKSLDKSIMGLEIGRAHV